MSQNALAHLAGIDPAYVNALERGNVRGRGGAPARPSLQVAYALATALGLNAALRDRFVLASGHSPYRQDSLAVRLLEALGDPRYRKLLEQVVALREGEHGGRRTD